MKRFLTIIAISFITIYVPIVWLFLIVSFADEFNAEIKSALTWLRPGDWEKLRGGLVILGVLCMAWMIAVATLNS